MTITEKERDILKKVGSMGGKKLFKEKGSKHFSEIGALGGRAGKGKKKPRKVTNS